MSKKSIDWHKEVLLSRKMYYAQQRDRLWSELAVVARGEKLNEWYARQIAEAERRKMTGFDRDRFLMPKKA
jgi:hypothetical protein